MDIKRLILSITLVMFVVLGYQLLIDHLNKQHPEWHLIATTESAETTTAPSTQSAAAASTTGPTTAAVANGSLTIAPASNGPTPSVGSQTLNDATYRMWLDLDASGAGLSSVILNDFKASAENHSPLYTFQEPLKDLEARSRPLATQSIVINGKTLDLSNIPWIAAPSSNPAQATFTATINDAGKPILLITKTYRLPERSDPDGSEGFEFTLDQTFQNLSLSPLTLSTTVNGPTLPPRESDRGEDRQFIAGYDDDREVATSSVLLTSLSTSHPDKDLVAADGRHMLWVGAASSYFDAIVRPDYTGQTAAQAIRIASAVASAVNPESSGDDRSAVLALQTADFTVAPGAQSNLNLKVFLGPKKRELLKNAYYSAYPRSYNITLIATGGWCGFLEFSPLINLLYGILWFFHLIFRDWGVAIICLVVLVRGLLHPITRKSQVNMMGMSKMGPELERLKKKYGDDKDELNKAMMQYYKEHGFTPILGCLPMFLQTPIWIALWSALQSTFELRQAPFLRFGPVHLTWIRDLSHPDALYTFAHPVVIPFVGWHLAAINLLPILMAGVYFAQQKTMPQPAVTTPEQQQQRKMMQWMTLLFPIMLYAGPSGLNLYILTSSGIGIFESKLIRDHIKQKEEAEKAGRIIVDVKPTRASKRRDSKEPPKPQGGIMGWIAKLQAKAEEIRREAERRGKDRA